MRPRRSCAILICRTLDTMHASTIASFIERSTRKKCNSPEPTLQKIPVLFPFSSCDSFYCRIHHRIIRIILHSIVTRFRKLASVRSCRFSRSVSSSVSSPTTHARAHGICKILLLKVCTKHSRIGSKVGVQSYYIVGRPPVKFHRNLRSFDTRTVDRSGTVIGLIVGRFRCF